MKARFYGRIHSGVVFSHFSLTFVPVGQEDPGHEFLLAVGPKSVPDHDLIFCELALQIQSITPVKLDHS